MSSSGVKPAGTMILKKQDPESSTINILGDPLPRVIPRLSHSCRGFISRVSRDCFWAAPPGLRIVGLYGAVRRDRRSPFYIGRAD